MKLEILIQRKCDHRTLMASHSELRYKHNLAFLYHQGISNDPSKEKSLHNGLKLVFANKKKQAQETADQNTHE